MIRWFQSAVIFCLFFISLMVKAADFPDVPNPFRYVNDYTKTLSSVERQYLENKLIEYSQHTSSQIAVVIIPTIAEYEIAQYTAELGDKWGIGRKQLNNGVLFLIAKNDRKVFIATGQGLQGVLPDAYLAELIRKIILPQFKQGRFAQGINDGLDHIIAVSQGEYEPKKQEEDPLDNIIPVLMVFIFIFFVVLSEYRSRRTPYISPTTNHDLTNAAIIASILNERHRHSSGFRGFNGGSSSGGGFGGGGFDGGGAGGSW